MLTPVQSQAVAGLLARRDLDGDYEMTRLAGGRNNRVYRLELAAQDRPLLLKAYYHHDSDRRDRLGAEFAFAELAWNAGLRNLPEPLACDREARLALYSFVDGRQPDGHEVDAAAVRSALDFCVTANRLREEGRDLPEASDACFTLADHLATVERRLAGLQRLEAGDALHRDALALLRDDLLPLFERIKRRMLDRAAEEGLAVDALLSQEERCLSPSDFGFHNALRRDDGSLVFVDFEYAGWDDPAKLVCDFFCQRAVPVPLEHYADFAEGVIRGLGLSTGHRRRCDMLMPIHRTKWVCMILQDFLPATRSRRSYAAAQDETPRLETQLAHARSATLQLAEA